MKTIKIFLASSEELKEERKELADIVANLNHILSKRDFFVDLVKWEYMDASMGTSHKQEEYNAELRECELCIVIYWTRFGKYTKTELDTAYDELKEGHNPKKLYVYFKDGENQTEELKAFKDSFPSEYGHFSTDFGNIDTLKAHFLLQFLEYMSSHLQVKDVLEIRDSQVTVNGQTFVNLANVPFAGNNEEYNLLLKNIKKTKKLLSISEPDDPEYSEYAQELQELEKKLSQMENSLWNTALMVTRLSSTKQSERLQRAMDLFNSGDNKGAMAVLNEEDIDRDVQHNLRLMELGEEGKKGLKTNIEEYTLRINMLWNIWDYHIHRAGDDEYIEGLGWTKEVFVTDDSEGLVDMTTEGWQEEVLSLHRKIIELASKIFGDESLEYAKYQENAAIDLCRLGEYQRAIEQYERVLSIRLKLLGETNLDVAKLYEEIGDDYYYGVGDSRKSLEFKEKGLQIRLLNFGENHPDVAYSYINVGLEYGELGDHRKALESLERALQIRLAVFGNNHPDVARSYDYVGNEYGELGDHRKALEYLEKALQIRLAVFGENHLDVARSYSYVGGEYGELGDHRKALEYAEKELKIRLPISGENFDVAALYNEIGYEYGELGDFRKELEYRTKGLEIAQSIEDVNLEAILHNKVGKTYQKMGDKEHAMEHFKRAADLFKDLGNEEEFKANIDLYNSLFSEIDG